MEEAVNLNLGELNLSAGEDDASGLVGLEEMLAKYEHNEVVRDILRSEGAELRERASAVEGRLHQVELDSIQDYVAESDNLVALQEQIRGCDGILGKMETLLGGFQTDLGKISSEVRARAGWVGARRRLTRALQIKTLQEQSFTMSLKLRNRKAAEAQLGQFVEDISLPPRLISAIVEGEASPPLLCSRPRSALTPRSLPPDERGLRPVPCAAAQQARVL